MMLGRQETLFPVRGLREMQKWAIVGSLHLFWIVLPSKIYVFINEKLKNDLNNNYSFTNIWTTISFDINIVFPV